MILADLVETSGLARSGRLHDGTTTTTRAVEFRTSGVKQDIGPQGPVSGAQEWMNPGRDSRCSRVIQRRTFKKLRHP